MITVVLVVCRGDRRRRDRPGGGRDGVTGQLATAPAQARFDMPEAVEFVASALPDDVSAQLSFVEVEGLLRGTSTT